MRRLLGTTVWLLSLLLSLQTAFVAAGKKQSVLAVADGPLKKFANTILESRRHLMAAAVARSTSIFSMYPVDTIKTRMQMEQPNAMRLTGLYSGVAGSLFGQVPYGVLTFGSYEMYKRSLLKRFPRTKPIFLYALAAVMGDLTGSGWLCPSEVVKQQMQVRQKTCLECLTHDNDTVSNEYRYHY
jgi:hypothetical protein